MSGAITALADLPLGARAKGLTALQASWVLAHDGQGHRLISSGEVVLDSAGVLWTDRRFPGEVAATQPPRGSGPSSPASRASSASAGRGRG